MPRFSAAGSVTANIRLMSAVAPEVMNCLAPFRTYLLPRFSARVFRFEASEPAWGSVSEKAALNLAAGKRLQKALLLFRRAVAVERGGDRRIVDAHDGGNAAVAARNLLHRQDIGDGIGARPAPFLGNRHAHEAERAHLGEQMARRFAGPVALGRRRGQPLLRELPGGIPDHDLVVGQHGRPLDTARKRAYSG